MKPNAIFLDFYGTLVHEDDAIIPIICERIRKSSEVECSINEIGNYWWKLVSKMYSDSFGPAFQAQRLLGTQSLLETILHFESSCDANELIQAQFEHWQKPIMFEDTISFLESIRSRLPVYILSNIDSDDVRTAIAYHGIKVDGVITSEDVRAYKPRAELFIEALSRYGMNSNEVIHIGDSIISDVFGAQQIGIDAVWLNRRNKAKPSEIDPKYICSDLSEVSKLL